MKEKFLWKSWYLMNGEEQSNFKDNDLLSCYLDNIGGNIDDYDEDDFEEYCQEVNDNYFNDDFGEYGNWYYSPLQNQEVAVVGTLGLWNGKHKIEPKKFCNLNKAILACLEDENEIFEDQYGNLHIRAYHHDGTNHFIIKKVVDNKLRCLHFRREVFGCK